MRLNYYFLSITLAFISLEVNAQHNNELYNNGATIHVQAGAEVHVNGDVHMVGATADLRNNGLIRTQGNTYSDLLFQQRGTGTYRIENATVNTGERQFIQGSYAVRGGQAATGVNDGSFYNLDLANDQGIVFLIGTGNIADVRNQVNFFAGTVQNRIVTHNIGITGPITYPANGSGYTGTFGIMNPTAGFGGMLNNTVSMNGNMSGVDAGYVQGEMRRAIANAGGTYEFIPGLEPAGAGAQKGVQYLRFNFGVNNYDVLSGYFETALDNTFPTAIECSGYSLDYWGGLDHGQWIMTDISGSGAGSYEVMMWPQDDNFPAKSVWMITKDNSIQGTADMCGPSPIGLNRSGFNGFSTFGVAASDISVLPIELIGISANGVQDHIAVKWDVASEINLSHYELERSEDAEVFEQITTLSALGTTNQAQSYNFNDFDVRTFQTYYYRVKSVDLDGSFEYSPIVSGNLLNSVDFSENALTLYPNPTQDEFMMSIFTDLDRSISITIYNSVGQAMENNQVNINSGNTVMKFNANQWAPGVYHIEIIDMNSSEKINKRIIKQQ